MDKNSNIIAIIKKHPKITIGVIGAGILAKPIFDILSSPVTIINELQKKSLLKQQLEELKAIKNLSNNKNDINKLPLQQKLIINPMS
jgi:hypothetical protein